MTAPCKIISICFQLTYLLSYNWLLSLKGFLNIIQQHLPRQRNNFVHPCLAQILYLTASAPRLLTALAVPLEIEMPIQQPGTSCTSGHLGAWVILLAEQAFFFIPAHWFSAPTDLFPSLHPCLPVQRFPQQEAITGNSHTGDAGTGSSACADTYVGLCHGLSLLITMPCWQKCKFKSSSTHDSLTKLDWPTDWNQKLNAT